MSIVNRLMAEIEEISQVMIAVGKIEFQKDFKARRLYELNQEKTLQEAKLLLALLKENSLE